MLITECVYRALTKESRELHIVADWIDDNRRDHLEAEVYCRRLRDAHTVRIQTLIDTIAKFGTRLERKSICRIIRVLMKHRKSTTMMMLPRRVPDLFSRDSRMKINRRIGNIIPTERRHGSYTSMHKKTLQAHLRKTRVFRWDLARANRHWFLQILVQLLGIIQPAG